MTLINQIAQLAEYSFFKKTDVVKVTVPLYGENSNTLNRI